MFATTPNFFSVMHTGTGCWLDLVLVRYKENISWTSSLPLGVCLHVYSTDPASSSDDMIIIPNKGREALGFATHVRRVIDRGIHPAPLTAFMQALPHCAWNSDGSDLCIRETKEMLASLPASNITERGGVIMLGSRRPLGLNQGLFGGQAQGDPMRACYLRAWTNMSGLPTDAAASLYAAFQARGSYLPGAQFAVTRDSLLHMSATLKQWFSRAEQQMRSPTLIESTKFKKGSYDDRTCCLSSTQRTCLPWLLERLWVMLFQLDRLSRDPGMFARPRGQEPPRGIERPQGGESHSNPRGLRDPAELADVLMANGADYAEMRRRALLPPILENVQRQFSMLAGVAAKAERLFGNLTSSHRGAVMQLFAPTRFQPVPEHEIYRMHAAAAGRIQLTLEKPQLARHHPPPATDDLEASLSQLKALRLAFTAASKWTHALKMADRERLLVLSNPADPLTSPPSTSKDTGSHPSPWFLVGQPRWARLICAIVATEVAEAKRACEGREEEAADGPARRPRQRL